MTIRKNVSYTVSPEKNLIVMELDPGITTWICRTEKAALVKSRAGC